MELSYLVSSRSLVYVLHGPYTGISAEMGVDLKKLSQM